MKVNLVILILTIFTCSGYSQIIKQEIYKTTENDVVYDFIKTSDGGHLFSGNIGEVYTGGADVFLLKTNMAGEIEWAKTYGGESDESGLITRPTSDGDYLIFGQTYSFENWEGSIYILKVDSDGELIWSKALNMDSWTYIYDVSDQLDNGDFLIAGTKNPLIFFGKEIFFCRMDQDGNFIWFKTYNIGGENDWVYDLTVLEGGDVLLCGRFNFTADMGFAGMMKLNEEGNVVWAKTYNSAGFGLIRRATVDANGNIYAVGRYDADGNGAYDNLMMKIDENGYPFWAKTYSGTSFDFGTQIQVLPSGNLLIAGTTDSFGFGDRDLFLMRVDNTGDFLWGKTYGGNNTDTHHGLLDFYVNDDQSIVIKGCSKSFSNGNSDIFMIHADQDGNSGCNETSYEPTAETYNYNVTNIFITVESYATGYTPTQVGNISFEYDLLCSDTLTTNIKSPKRTETRIKIVPNPANQSVHILYGKQSTPANYIITSMNGEIVKRERLGELDESKIDVSKLSSGVYFLDVYSANNQIIGSQKLIIP